jgi:hypothetical protein
MSTPTLEKGAQEAMQKGEIVVEAVTSGKTSKP